MPRITFTDKVDSRIINVNPINKIISSNVNELKDGINNNEIDIVANTSAIALNTPKISFDSTSSTRLAGTSGTNTGDQDVSGFQLKSEKDSVSGYAGLDGSGKINPSQLPALAITDTFVVASQSAMLALTAQVGDVAIRTDLSKTFILKTDGSTVLANWQELQTPTDLVTTVFGRSGVVTAQNNDYTFAQINKSTSSLADLTTRNFSDLQNKPTTILGYGITDSYTETEVNTLDAQNVKLTGNQSIDGEKTFLDSFKITTGSKFLAKTSDSGSHVVAMIDSSSDADAGGLAIKTGDNNDDESALYILNYQDDTLFKIKATNGNLESTGSATFGSSVTADGLRINGSSSYGIVVSSSSGASSGLRLFNDSVNDNAYIYNNYNGTLQLGSGNTTALTLNSNQSATFASDLTVKAPSGSSNSSTIFLIGNNGGAFGGSNVVRSKIESQTDGTAFGANMLLYTNNTSNVYQEALRLNSDQSATFASSVTFGGGTFSSGSNKVKISQSSEAGYIQTSANVSTAVDHNYFYNSNGLVGRIQTSGLVTSYITSSDYRLKEDLKDFNGLEMISNIPVYNHKWKVDNSRSYSVLAHELQEVLPQAVSGEKDGEEMQGVDYSKIVPLLIKSIQELTAKVELLENK